MLTTEVKDRVLNLLEGLGVGLPFVDDVVAVACTCHKAQDT